MTTRQTRSQRRAEEGKSAVEPSEEKRGDVDEPQPVEPIPIPPAVESAQPPESPLPFTAPPSALAPPSGSYRKLAKFNGQPTEWPSFYLTARTWFAIQTPRADYIVDGPQEYDPQHPLLRDVSYSVWKQVQGRGFYDLLTACNATSEHVASAIAQTSTTQNATQFLALLKQSYEGIGRVSKHHAISKANQLTMADTSVESVRKFCTSFQDLINMVHEDKEAPLGSQLYDALCRKIPSHLISKDSLYDEYQDGSPKFPTSRKIMAQLQRVTQDMEHESFNTGIKPKVQSLPVPHPRHPSV